MARQRIIYQSQAVKIGANVAKGVQSCSYGLDVTREDVLQFGDLGAVDRIILEAPVANMEVSMYVNGLTASQVNDILQDGISGNPIDISIGLDNDEGQDYTAANSAVTIVSGALTSLSAEASVGAIPTMTMGFEGTDLSYASKTISPPARDINVATQSGVVVNVSGIGSDASGHYVHPQSCSVSFDLGVEGLQELSLATQTNSNKYQYARVPSYPATATMELEAFAVDKGMTMTLANLEQKASDGTVGDANDGGYVTVGVNMGGTTFTLQSGTLDSVSFSNAIGDTAATCSATFAVSIGSTTSPSTLLIS
tara:strand:+ start:2717 stop:3646 length:930 start_codon:yes stop_codon:yes gene_type:complete